LGEQGEENAGRVGDAAQE